MGGTSDGKSNRRQQQLGRKSLDMIYTGTNVMEQSTWVQIRMDSQRAGPSARKGIVGMVIQEGKISTTGPTSNQEKIAESGLVTMGTQGLLWLIMFIREEVGQGNVLHRNSLPLTMLMVMALLKLWSIC
jgi:hypothetical protein